MVAVTADDPAARALEEVQWAAVVEAYNLPDATPHRTPMPPPPPGAVRARPGVTRVRRHETVAGRAAGQRDVMLTLWVALGVYPVLALCRMPLGAYVAWTAVTVVAVTAGLAWVLWTDGIGTRRIEGGGRG